MQGKTKTVMLKDIPQDVDRLIEKEQMRLDLYEDQKLKKAPVVYHIIREWYSLKSSGNNSNLNKQN